MPGARTYSLTLEPGRLPPAVFDRCPVCDAQSASSSQQQHEYMPVSHLHFKCAAGHEWCVCGLPVAGAQVKKLEDGRVMVYPDPKGPLQVVCAECGAPHAVSKNTLDHNLRYNGGRYVCCNRRKNGRQPANLRNLDRCGMCNTPEHRARISQGQRIKAKESMASLPESLQGAVAEVRGHRCEMCGGTWQQDCRHARQTYRMHGNRLICARCARAKASDETGG